MTTTTRTLHDFISGESPGASILDAMPQGWNGIDVLDADISSIGATETTILTVDAPNLVGRKIEATVNLDMTGTVANDLANVLLRENGTLKRRWRRLVTVTGGPGSESPSHSFAFDGASGTTTYTVSIVRESGSGTFTARSSAQLVIKDIGAAS